MNGLNQYTAAGPATFGYDMPSSPTIRSGGPDGTTRPVQGSGIDEPATTRLPTPPPR